MRRKQSLQVADQQMLALIYCRVSTNKQEEKGTSLDSQSDACTLHAEKLGFKVGRIIKESFTGAELWDRPMLAQARADIRAKKYQGLVVYAIDRLSRDIAHLAIIADEVERAGAQLIFVSEDLDNTPEGKLMQSVRGYVAEVERLKIRERCVRGKRQRALNGMVHNSGTELYGYRRDKERGVREIYEPEAQVIRQIYQWVMEGASIRKVVRWLNEQGIASPSTGKKRYADGRSTFWGKGSVGRILREPAYKGEAYAWRFKSGKRLNEIVSRPQEEWIKLPEGSTPAIVTPDVWDAVQRRLQANCGDATRNESRPYLLRGRVFCGTCGRKMRGDIEHRGNNRVYRCSSRETPSGACGGKRVPAADCEGLVWKQIADILEQPEIITAELERRESENAESREPLLSDLDAARQKLRRTEDEIARLVSRAASAEDDLWKLFEKEITAKQQIKLRFEQTIDELTSRLNTNSQATRNLVTLTEYCDQVRDHLGRFGFDEKRLALEALDVRVFADGREWRVDVSFPLDADVSSNAGNSSQSFCWSVRPVRAKRCWRNGFRPFCRRLSLKPHWKSRRFIPSRV